MAKFNGIAMLIASNGRPISMEWALSLVAFQMPVGMSAAWIVAQGSERAQQREALLERAVDLGADYAMFLDDDTVSPAYAIQQLHYHLNQEPDALICGGIYCTKSDIPEPLVFQEIGGGCSWDWKIGEIFECKGLGTGCMMIKTGLLKNIPKPWFLEPHYVPIGETIELNGIEVPRGKVSGTDDLYFCQKVIDAGYKILAHGGVLPVHIAADGKQYSLPLDSYPCRDWQKQIADATASGKSEMIFKRVRPSTGGPDEPQTGVSQGE